MEKVRKIVEILYKIAILGFGIVVLWILISFIYSGLSIGK